MRVVRRRFASSSSRRRLASSKPSPPRDDECRASTQTHTRRAPQLATPLTPPRARAFHVAMSTAAASTARRLFQDDDGGALGDANASSVDANSNAPDATVAVNDAARANDRASGGREPSTTTPTLVSAAIALEALEFSPIKGVVSSPASPSATTPASPPVRSRVAEIGDGHARNLSFEFFTDDDDDNSSFASATEASMLENATSELTFQSAHGKTLAYDDDESDDDTASKRDVMPAWVKPTMAVVVATLGMLVLSKSKPKSKTTEAKATKKAASFAA